MWHNCALIFERAQQKAADKAVREAAKKAEKDAKRAETLAALKAAMPQKAPKRQRGGQGPGGPPPAKRQRPAKKEGVDAPPPNSPVPAALLGSPPPRRSREEQHVEYLRKAREERDRERRRSSGDPSWEPKASTRDTGLFAGPAQKSGSLSRPSASADDAIAMPAAGASTAPAASTSASWHLNGGGQRCAEPPRHVLPTRPPPQRVGAKSSSIMANTGFAMLPDGAAMYSGDGVYGRCGPECKHVVSKYPELSLRLGEHLPTRLMQRELMPDGRSWWEVREQGDHIFCLVPLTLVRPTLSVQGGVVRLQLAPRTVELRTHFRADCRSTRTAHKVSSSQQKAWRGMQPSELADGSLRKSSGHGTRADYASLQKVYPAVALRELAEKDAPTKDLWLALFRMERNGHKPLAPDALQFRVGGITDSARCARGNVLKAVRSFRETLSTIGLDREGGSQARTYDVAGSLKVGDEEAKPIAGSFRNAGKEPGSAEQLDDFYRNLEKAAAELTGGVVHCWGADMETHCEANTQRVLCVDALAGIRSFLPTATPKGGIPLGADFLVPVFYPGVVYKHQGMSDARMIAGIVTGFFDAIIEFFDLSEADLDEHIESFA